MARPEDVLYIEINEADFIDLVHCFMSLQAVAMGGKDGL
jgi:hypothetical protein